MQNALLRASSWSWKCTWISSAGDVGGDRQSQKCHMGSMFEDCMKIDMRHQQRFRDRSGVRKSLRCSQLCYFKSVEV